MIYFSVLETFIFAGILQAFVLLIALGKKLNPSSAEFYYYLLVVISTIMLIARILGFTFHTPAVYRYAIFADTTIFLIGPITYLYLQRQYHTGYRLKHIHFVPAILHLGFFLTTCFISSENLITAYQTGTLSFIFFLIEFSGLLSFGGYLILAIMQFKRKLLASQKKSDLVLMAAWLLVYITWLFSFFSTYFLGFSLQIISYDLIWVVIPCWIHLYGYLKLAGRLTPNGNQKPKFQRVKKEKQEVIIQRLEDITQTSYLFLNADLKLDDLAKKVNASSNDLSWVLNEVYQMSFYEFINKVRLDKFVNKIRHQEHREKTLLALSFEVGFKSKSTFNKAFKSVYNQTPTQYINNLDECLIFEN